MKDNGSPNFNACKIRLDQLVQPNLVGLCLDSTEKIKPRIAHSYKIGVEINKRLQVIVLLMLYSTCELSRREKLCNLIV